MIPVMASQTRKKEKPTPIFVVGPAKQWAKKLRFEKLTALQDFEKWSHNKHAPKNAACVRFEVASMPCIHSTTHMAKKGDKFIFHPMKRTTNESYG